MSPQVEKRPLWLALTQNNSTKDVHFAGTLLASSRGRCPHGKNKLIKGENWWVGALEAVDMFAFKMLK